MFSFRSINSTTTQPFTTSPPTTNNNVMFSLFKRIPQTTLAGVGQIQTPPTPPEKYPKMLWGEPTWNFLHTMVEKIIPENFFRLRSEIFDIVKTICYNLPCPDCANHARTYINRIDFNRITTKEHLKIMLFDFHNMVNTRKHIALFDVAQLTPRYSNFTLAFTLKMFLYHFRDKHKSSRMIADDMYRSKLSFKIERWFIANIQHFEL